MAAGAVTAEFNLSYDCVIEGVQYQGVLSPLSRALLNCVNVVELLSQNPSEGDQVLAELVSQTATDIQAATGPINYVIAGAEPAFTSPMEYGGHFLEIDRDLMGDRKPAITLIGGAETYIDIVSDLAETFLIWNPVQNPVDPEEAAKMTRAQIVTIVSNFPTLTPGGSQ